VAIIEPGAGELASGLVGKGRMAEPEEIVEQVKALFEAQKKKSLVGKRYIVTAGATIEPIDPVRYITNHSSGKMGYAIAEELAVRGAEVKLISGRTALATPTGVERIDVLSAEDMYNAAVREWDSADGGIMCAAVADYTPKCVADHKLKKGEGDMSIELKRTRDIAKQLGETKQERILVGFALETDNEEANAEGKLERKNFDFIVLNSLRDEGAGFRGDTNKITIIDRAGRVEHPLMTKREVAAIIVDNIEKINK
jgi:phosphopantothenoylcysteine decarboxylase/phosphopantothenate--cysteine ligase